MPQLIKYALILMTLKTNKKNTRKNFANKKNLPKKKDKKQTQKKGGVQSSKQAGNNCYAFVDARMIMKLLKKHNCIASIQDFTDSEILNRLNDFEKQFNDAYFRKITKIVEKKEEIKSQRNSLLFADIETDHSRDIEKEKEKINLLEQEAENLENNFEEQKTIIDERKQFLANNRELRNIIIEQEKYFNLIIKHIASLFGCINSGYIEEYLELLQIYIEECKRGEPPKMMDLQFIPNPYDHKRSYLQELKRKKFQKSSLNENKLADEYEVVYLDSDEQVRVNPFSQKSKTVEKNIINSNTQNIDNDKKIANYFIEMGIFTPKEFDIIVKEKKKNISDNYEKFKETIDNNLANKYLSLSYKIEKIEIMAINIYLDKTLMQIYNSTNITTKIITRIKKILKNDIYLSASLIYRFDAKIYDDMFYNNTDVFSDNYENEILNGGNAENDDSENSHSVALVGFNEELQCFLFKNSWGINNGNFGKFEIPEKTLRYMIMVNDIEFKYIQDIGITDYEEKQTQKITIYV
jgi:hypothetical protein